MLTSEEKLAIKETIATAEKESSGEIRVCVEVRCPAGQSSLDRATACFHRLKMHKTALRNGVLIYVAWTDRQFAVIGDIGINKLVPVDFWEATKSSMLAFFKKGEIAKGIVRGVLTVGQQLGEFFPHQSNDVNEISDEVVVL